MIDSSWRVSIRKKRGCEEEERVWSNHNQMWGRGKVGCWLRWSVRTYSVPESGKEAPADSLLIMTARIIVFPVSTSLLSLLYNQLLRHNWYHFYIRYSFFNDVFSNWADEILIIGLLFYLIRINWTAITVGCFLKNGNVMFRI